MSKKNHGFRVIGRRFTAATAATASAYEAKFELKASAGMSDVLRENTENA